jgi:DNA-binding CsgD family transcriptional regulator
MMRQTGSRHEADADDARDHRLVARAGDGADILGTLLAQLGTAAVLVDAAGGVVAVSAAARGCLGEALLIREGRLAADDPRTDRALVSLVDKALGRGRRATDETVIVERRNRRPLVVRAVPLDLRAASLFGPACAMLVVVDAACAPLPSEAQLSSLFALSHGEAQLARCLAAGDTLAIAAPACGISYETARKRLKSIFAKTDTGRQAELVALLVRIGSIFGVAVRRNGGGLRALRDGALAGEVPASEHGAAHP